jgi:hypothetical protein
MIAAFGTQVENFDPRLAMYHPGSKAKGRMRLI